MTFHQHDGPALRGEEIARLRALRADIENHLEHMLAVLDALDGDPDLEDGHDDEPSLGGPLDDDREHDDSDNELSLGWAANTGQLALGTSTDDGDETALERFGAGFIRSGEDDAEDDDPAGGDIQDRPHDGELDIAEAGDDNGIGDASGLEEQSGRLLAYDERLAVRAAAEVAEDELRTVVRRRTGTALTPRRDGLRLVCGPDSRVYTITAMPR